MAHQTSWVIQCQRHLFRRTALRVIAGRIRWVHTFSKGISPKVNVIARLEFELAYFETAIQHLSHYTIDLLPTACLRSASIPKRVLETLENVLTPLKNSQEEVYFSIPI